ncbi:high-affinity branched-chain amino acid transporter permease [Salmonella enterica subsp. arizonae]|uniref:High-affinity branched-chain amino acid transporter permease n=1 Tax=Salmonella enterica subsp. arizonae TaxID=59203 RepID=A0A379SPV5_SALER|nr:high-affinity branched-chain amino acid transporter permease [Salmonella enterica subsp. arizonae]
MIALLIIAVAWPFMVSRGSVDIATLTMIYIILGLGLNVVVGLSGLLVLGYGGFYAIGAYTFALLNHYYGLGFWTCLPLAGLVAAAAGFLLGFPVLRLRGDYLAIVTLGFGEIVRILLLNNTEVTGGPNGISQIPKPTLFGLEFSRSAREGGWDTFSNFFGVKYDPSDRVIFFIWWPCCWWYCRCLSLIACCGCRWGVRGRRCVKMRSPVVLWASAQRASS